MTLIKKRGRGRPKKMSKFKFCKKCCSMVLVLNEKCPICKKDI